MHILFLTQVLPYPLDAGPKTRAYYVLRYLAQHHTVTLLSFVRPSDAQTAIDHLRDICHEVHVVQMNRSNVRDARFLIQSLVSWRPFLIQRDRIGGMFSAIDTLVASAAKKGEPFDAVHADQSWMADYALHAYTVAPVDHKPRKVLDQHNAVYMIARRLAIQEGNPAKRALLALEERKMARWEVKTCAEFDHIVWVTEPDYLAVQEVAPGSDPHTSIRNDGIIPICGDPEAIQPLQVGTQARRVTFLGGMHYPPNAQGILWYARHCFPAVLQHVPDAILTIIGKQPPAELYQLGIPAENLDVAGYVDDPLPLLRESAVFVVPLHAGGGMRVKIVDGLVWGLAIVSTRIGAEGISLHNESNVLLADTPEEMSRATVRLLDDPDTRRRIGAAGRMWVLEHLNWRTTYRAWDEIYPPQERVFREGRNTE